MREARILALAVACLVLLPACIQRLDTALPPNLVEVDRIRNDASLSPQEKRRELEQLGLSPLVINAVLRAERTGNQFGGDLRSAFEKVSGDRFTELTPDEVQIYADAARTADPDVSFTPNDAEAQAVVSFFRAEQISSSDELSRFLGNPENEAPAEIPDGILQQLFVDFDPNQVIDQID